MTATRGANGSSVIGEVWRMLGLKVPYRTRRGPHLVADEDMIRIVIPESSTWVLANGNRPASHHEIQHTPARMLYWRGLFDDQPDMIQSFNMDEMREIIQFGPGHAIPYSAAGNPTEQPRVIDPDLLWQDFLEGYSWLLSMDFPAMYGRINSAARIHDQLLTDLTLVWGQYSALVAGRIRVIQEEMFRLQNNPTWRERDYQWPSWLGRQLPGISLADLIQMQRVKLDQQGELMRQARRGTAILEDIANALHRRAATPETTENLAVLSQQAREQDEEISAFDEIWAQIEAFAKKVGIDPIALLIMGVVVILVMFLLMSKGRQPA